MVLIIGLKLVFGQIATGPLGWVSKNHYGLARGQPFSGAFLGKPFRARSKSGKNNLLAGLPKGPFGLGQKAHCCGTPKVLLAGSQN